MTKLMDYLTQSTQAVDIADEDTAKVEAPIDFSYLKPRCHAFDIVGPCDGEGVLDYITTEGRIRKLCALHYYKLMCLRTWDEARRQKREQEAS